MKSSSKIPQDRFRCNSNRERCLNTESLVPLILTISVFFASIFSFFLLRSPNHSSFILNQASDFVQNQQHHAQENASSSSSSKPPQKEEEKTCDLFKGLWVPASRESSYYSNSSCITIPYYLNCFKNGREDRDFLNWKWKPQQCKLPRFHPKIFFDIVRGKKMAFIGDSLARNHMQSLLCLLSQEETPIDVQKDPEDRFRTWYFPSHDFTLKTLWSRFLIAGEERMVNGTGSNIFDMQLDKVDEDWGIPFPELDYAIISAGHWFNRIMYLHEGGKLVGCVYCREPNVTDYNSDFPFRRAFETAFRFINGCKKCRRTVTLLRTFAPAHFEGGSWNTGGHCNRTGPVSEEMIDFECHGHMRNIQVEEFERAKHQGWKNGHKLEIIDVTRAMLMRPDGHPGAHWGKTWVKGYTDCTHWCMPGPVDFWNELMLAVLKRV
ncbi:hypothetical protein L6164_007380 [Bauhinia variegata]|uniref:Uncharacterized protein n=1 Tax=Bauhinia variegata TaxID=167791 RepID=A0ACB9PEX6_BAUVA|nr:hypothetical protein L6164_007380 [Bauhinia variegata]